MSYYYFKGKATAKSKFANLFESMPGISEELELNK